FPRMVRDFQSVIGREARAQVLERYGRLPRTVVACVGGGSNAIGIFSAFLDDPGVELVGVEAAGPRLQTHPHPATPSRGAARGVPRQQELPAAGRRWPGAAGPFDFGGAGLSRCGAGARFLEGRRSGIVSDGDGPTGPGCVRCPGPSRRDRTRPRERPCCGVGQVRERTVAAWRPRPVQPQRSGGQGRRPGCRAGGAVTEAFGTELALPPAQVEELLSLVGKALRAVQLYLPNNPVYQRAIENVRGACRKIWESTEDLALEVQETELRWEGNL